MTRKIILSGIIGAILSGCFGGDVGSPSTSGTSAEKMSFAKLSSSAKSLSGLTNVKLQVAPGSFAYTTELSKTTNDIRNAIFSRSDQYTDESLTDFSHVFLIPERLVGDARSTFAIDVKDVSLEGLLIDYNYDFIVDVKDGSTSIGHLTSGSADSLKHPTFVVKNGTLNVGSVDLIGVDITTEATGKIVLKPYGTSSNFPKYFGLSSSNLTLGQDFEIPEGYEAKIENGSIKGGKTLVNRGRTTLADSTLDITIENYGAFTLYSSASATTSTSLEIKNFGIFTQIGNVNTVDNQGTYFAGNTTNFSNEKAMAEFQGVQVENLKNKQGGQIVFYRGNVGIKTTVSTSFSNEKGAYFSMYGGEIKTQIQNAGKFIFRGGKVGDFTNKDGGIFSFADNRIKHDVWNSRTPSANAEMGHLKAEGTSDFKFFNGYKTLKAKEVTFNSNSIITVVLNRSDALSRTLLESSGPIDFNGAKINASIHGAVKRGDEFILFKGSVIRNFGDRNKEGLTGKNLPSSSFALITDAANTTITLKVLNDFSLSNTLPITPPEEAALLYQLDLARSGGSVAQSSHHHIGGHFRKHKHHPEGILKDPHKKHGHKKKVRFEKAALSFSGDDLNISNFNTRGTELNMTVGTTTFSADFAKNNQAFDGTFGLLNVKDFDGFTLTNSLEFTSKSGLEGEHVASQFNDTSFMTAVSKHLVSGDFTLTPSISVGYSRLSDFSASMDNFNVQGASAGAYVADFSVDAVQSFKVVGLEMNVSGGVSFGIKSAQSFELKNAFGETMNAQASNQNLGLSFGFSAKLDSNTSFYATAQTESYNNSKKMEFGVKF